MALSADSHPTDLASAHAMIVATREALLAAEARASAGERGEIPGAADREAQVHNRQAAPRHARPILRAERDPGTTQLALADLQEDASQRDDGADGRCPGEDRTMKTAIRGIEAAN